MTGQPRECGRIWEMDVHTISQFKYPHHWYLLQFITNADNLLVHRLRIAQVMANTDRLAFRQDLEDVSMIEEAIKDELDFDGNELMLYASLGIFKPSELLAQKYNTMEGVNQMIDALYKTFRRL